MRGTTVTIQDLHKTFYKGGQEISVLRGINLEISGGEKVAVLGPSGSGKSTFLHLLGTLDRPEKGRILFDGTDALAGTGRQVDARRNREIGFVFQFHHLLSDHSALWNVAMPAVIAGLGVQEALDLARQALTRMSLGHRESHKPGELSGGEQQRVAIARAMVMKPGLILADEPTGNLDPKTASGVFDELLGLRDEAGCSLVVVTHSQELAARFPRRLQLVDGQFMEEKWELT